MPGRASFRVGRDPGRITQRHAALQGLDGSGVSEQPYRYCPCRVGINGFSARLSSSERAPFALYA